MIHSFKVRDFSKDGTKLMDCFWFEFFDCYECIYFCLGLGDFSVCAFAEIGYHFVFFCELFFVDFDELLLVCVCKVKHFILVT